MPQASLQLGSILGDGVLSGALKTKKGAVTGVDALLGGGAKNADAFRNLLLGVHKARQGDLVGATLTGAPVEVKTVDINIGPILESLPPEVAAVLKKLNITALKNVPPQIATLFNKVAAEAPAANTLHSQAFVEAVAKLAADEPIPSDMFDLIADPDMAALLAALNTMVLQARDENIAVDADGMVTLLFDKGVNDRPASQTALPAGVSAPAIFEAAQKRLDYLSRNTITIADLDGDSFQKLKKLLFADIAPYLTAPRTVRVNDGTVMKIAAGPAFLNDDNTDTALLAQIAGMASLLPPHVVGALKNIDAGAPLTAEETAALTAFLNGGQPGSAQGKGAQIPADPGAKTHPLADQGGQAPAAPSAKTAGAPVLPASAQGSASTHASAPVLPASTAATRGFETVMKGLDHVMAPADGVGDGLESLLRLHADPTQPLNAASTLISARSAASQHPATHLVSAALQRAIIAELPAAPGTERAFSIQLEPGSLGRVRITLEFGENNAVKAKLLAERPETLSLMQKDANLLERALVNAGLDAGRTQLSFDLASGDSFSGSLQDQQGQANGGSKGKKDNGTEFATIETLMPVFVDPDTGLTHVNVVI